MQAYEIDHPVEGFVIHERIGRGGSATVYRATQKALNREVALKAVPLHAQAPAFQHRFSQEAQVIASLEHPSIVPIYSFGIYQTELAYFAMRLMRGGSLASRLQGSALPADEVVEIATQIGRALGYAHSRGVLHRDLKLSNILLDEQGNAFLADFGLAKLLSGDTQPSQQISGSAAYIAPEQVQGSPATIQSDIYSLGMLIYHMLVGHPAFEGSAMSICYSHVHKQPVPPHQQYVAVPPPLSEAVMQALEKDPAARYPHAEAFVEALNTAINRKYSTDLFRVIAPRSTHKAARARRWLLAVPVLLLAAAAAMIALPRSARNVQQIETGQSAEISSLSFSEAEIDAARAALGDGFIANIVCDFSALNQLVRAREISELAQANGIDFRAYDSKNNPGLQAALVQQAREEGARAFILCPVSTDSLNAPVAALESDGIPVIFSAFVAYSYGLKMASDYAAAGRTMAALAARIAHDEFGGEASVVILTFPGTPTAEHFDAGVEAELRVSVPDINLIGFWPGFQTEDGEAVVQRLLSEGRDIDIIIAITDRVAYGAIAALERAGIPPSDVAIISAGGDLRAQNYIRNRHYLRGTLEVNRTQGASLLFTGLVKLLAGSPVPEVLLLEPGELLTRETLPTQ